MNRDDNFRDDRFFDDQYYIDRSNDNYRPDQQFSQFPGNFDREYDSRFYDQDYNNPDFQRSYPPRENDRPQRSFFNNRNEMPRDDYEYMDGSLSNVIITSPNCYGDIQHLIDCLKNNQAIIVDLARIDDRICQRILDFLSGAIYALNGSQQRIANSIFLLTPAGMRIKIPVDIEEQLKNRKSGKRKK